MNLVFCNKRAIHLTEMHIQEIKIKEKLLLRRKAEMLQISGSLLQLQILKFEILKCAICKKIVAEECKVRPHKKMNISLDNRLLITLTKLISLDLRDVELPEEAVDAGLLEASFFSRRLLSIPFSRGE